MGLICDIYGFFTRNMVSDYEVLEMFLSEVLRRFQRTLKKKTKRQNVSRHLGPSMCDFIAVSHMWISIQQVIPGAYYILNRFWLIDNTLDATPIC